MHSKDLSVSIIPAYIKLTKLFTIIICALTTITNARLLNRRVNLGLVKPRLLFYHEGKSLGKFKNDDVKQNAYVSLST